MGSTEPKVCLAWAAALCIAFGLSGCGSRPEAVAGPVLTQDGAVLKLENVAAEAGLNFTHRNSPRTPITIVETMGSGCAYLDYNGDGWQDVFLLSAGADFNKPKQPNESRLFRNDKGRFVDVTEASGIVVDGYAMGCCVGDFDGDGAIDLFVSGFKCAYLFRNRGDGSFENVTANSGIRVGSNTWGAGCAFLDFNRDGKLDLFVSSYVIYDPKIPLCHSGAVMSGCTPNQYKTQAKELYLNLGNGRFKECAKALGADDPAGAGLGVTVCDFDNDGWPDIFCANDGTPNALLHNRRGKFTDIGNESGVAYAESGVMRAGMGCDAADIDGDGDFDLVITNFQHEPNSLYRNGSKMFFQETTYPSGIGTPSVLRLAFGVSFADLDGDGKLDLYVGNGHVMDNVHEFDDTATFEQVDLAFRNVGGGKFAEVSSQWGLSQQTASVARGLAIGDYDNNGVPDILINCLGRPAKLLQPARTTKSPWLGIQLEPRRSSTEIGARITVQSPAGSQVREVRSGGSYLSQADLRALFSLPEIAQSSELRVSVRWPDGTDQSVKPKRLNEYLTVAQEAKQ